MMRVRIVAGAVCALLAFGPAQSAEIKLLASGAMKEIISELLPEFEKASGQKVTPTWTGTANMIKLVGAGEVFDLVVIGVPEVDKFIAEGKFAQGSRADLARSGVGIAVKAGAPKPDISSADAVKKALLNARAVAYSTGPSGTAVLALFDLDHTLLSGDSDVLWCDFLMDHGLLDRAEFAPRNADMESRYKAGTVGVEEFTHFFISTLAGRTPAEWEPWRQRFMAEVVAPRLPPDAHALVQRHLTAGDTVVLTTATNRFITELTARHLQIDHLIATAYAWGGNPKEAAMYSTVTPKDNDGSTPYVLTVKDVPVRGFWSITVYTPQKLLYANTIQRYVISSPMLPSLARDPDGGFTLYVQNELPGALSGPRAAISGWTS